MEEAVLGERSTLAPERLAQLQWIEGLDQYSYVEGKGKDSKLVIASAGSDSKSELNLTDLSSKFQSLSGKALTRFPSIKWTNANVFSFEQNQNIYTYNIDKKSLAHSDSLELEKNAANRDEADGTGYIAYTRDNNLYILAGNKTLIVNENENKDIISGQTVSRSEFGIYKGTFWSPDGKKLAYYVKDESDVEDYPIVNWNTTPATVDFIKYPMAGTSKTEKLEVRIYDTETNKTVTLKTGEPNSQYLTNLAWSPDNESLYIAHLNREQKHLELKRYDVSTGELDKVLFEEKSDKYVEPLQPIHFVTGRNDMFVWESSRTGFNHLYLYNTKGKLQKQLTDGNWEVTNFEGFDVSGLNAFFTSTRVSPLNRDLYSVSLKKGMVKRLTDGDGTHMTTLSPSGNFFIDNFTSTTIPWRSEVHGISFEYSIELINSKNPLSDYKMGEMKLFSIKDNDGGDLYCRMYYPTDFDSTKKYPVVVYLYGGPHAQMVRNTWGGGGNLWYQYMAQRGYIVWTLDNRGSGNRGSAWEQNTYHQLGTVEMEDQLTGIEYLRAKKYVDAERIGIHGWSYGGFMSMSLMTRKPGVFKVCVAGGPVIDWSLYEVMYTEGMMGTPESNPDGYKNSNLLNYVSDLDGKLLIIHGTSDPVVVWQHSQLYVQKAIKEGVQVDYFMYPMHEHNVRGKERIHLMQKVTDYFMDYL